MDFQLSSIITLGSGLPFNIGGRGPGLKPDWYAAYPEKHAFIIPAWEWAYRQVDLRLAKEFGVWGGQKVEFTLDAINVFNFKNYSGFNETYTVNGAGVDLNPTFGRPTAQFMPTRSFQVGLRYSF